MMRTLIQTDIIVTIFLVIFGSVLLSNLIALFLTGILKLLIFLRKIT